MVSCRRLLAAVPASGQATLFAALSLANVGGFGFHALASRQLGPSSYGILSSLLALLAAVTVPMTAFQAILTAQVRRRHEEGHGILLLPTLNSLAVVGLGGALAFSAVAPLVAGFLSLDSVRPLLLTAMYLVPMTCGTIGWAVLTGTGRFAAAAVAVLASVATRFLAGLVLLPVAGVDGAIFASVLSETMLAACLLMLAARNQHGARPLTLSWGGGAYSTATSVGLWLLTGAGILLARHLFPGLAAGQFAAAATIASIAMYVPQSIGAVFLPSFADSDGSSALAALRRALRYAGVLGAAGALLLTLLSRFVTVVLFGESFDVPLPLVAVLSATSVLLAAVYVVVQYHLARNSRRALAPWAGVAALVTAAGWLHPGVLALGSLLLVTTLFALVLALNGVALEALPTRPGLVPAVDHPLDLTVVIPYFNPGLLLRPHVGRLVQALDEAGVSFEVVTVSDGSTDGSPSSLDDLDAAVVHRLLLPVNTGKGEALCAGLRVARGRYVGFIDADGDLDPLLWQPLLELLRIYRPDAIIGSKRHPLSDVTTTRLRRVYSWGFQTLTWWLFRLPVRDSQVGLKVFRREVLADALPLTREQRFIFDLELLVIARRLGYRRIMEAPVRLAAQGRSTVGARTVVRMLFATLRLAWRLQTLSPNSGPVTPGARGRGRVEVAPTPAALSEAMA